MVSSVGHTPFGLEPTTISPNLHIRIVYASHPLSIMLFPREPSETSRMPENHCLPSPSPYSPINLSPFISINTLTVACVFQDYTRFSNHSPDTVNNRMFFPLFYLIHTYTRGQRRIELYDISMDTPGTTLGDFPVDRRLFVDVFPESWVFVIEPRKSLESNENIDMGNNKLRTRLRVRRVLWTVRFHLDTPSKIRNVSIFSPYPPGVFCSVSITVHAKTCRDNAKWVATTAVGKTDECVCIQDVIAFLNTHTTMKNFIEIQQVSENRTGPIFYRFSKINIPLA